MQVLLLGVIAAAAGIGSFLGNAVGARLQFGSPDQVVIGCLTAALLTVVLAAVLPGLVTAAAVGLVGATASSLAKVSLDAVIQDDVPDESRASAFGRSETILQLGWVFGGAIGVLLPTEYWIGFTVMAAMAGMFFSGIPIFSSFGIGTIIVVGVAFVLPGFVLIVILAWLYVEVGITSPLAIDAAPRDCDGAGSPR